MSPVERVFHSMLGEPEVSLPCLSFIFQNYVLEDCTHDELTSVDPERKYAQRIVITSNAMNSHAVLLDDCKLSTSLYPIKLLTNG